MKFTKQNDENALIIGSAELKSIWLGRWFWNITFDEDVECDPDEIRALFENEEPNS
jgi:hypothetical protein